jgi:hypothetical protein
MGGDIVLQALYRTKRTWILTLSWLHCLALTDGPDLSNRYGIPDTCFTMPALQSRDVCTDRGDV